MRNEFSTFDVSKALGEHRGRLREWVELGFLTPTEKAKGQGTKAVFSRNDVYAVALFRLMVEGGFNRSVAGDYVSKFVKDPDMNNAVYILFKESVVLGDKRKTVTVFEKGDWKIDLTIGALDKLRGLPGTSDDENWRTIFIVNYKKLRQEVDAALGVI